MDGSIILTAVSTVLAIAAVNIGLIAWLRTDMKSFESKIESWKEEINKETKYFHGRLCRIEARRGNRMEGRRDKR